MPTTRQRTNVHGFHMRLDDISGREPSLRGGCRVTKNTVATAGQRRSERGNEGTARATPQPSSRFGANNDGTFGIARPTRPVYVISTARARVPRLLLVPRFSFELSKTESI